MSKLPAWMDPARIRFITIHTSASNYRRSLAVSGEQMVKEINAEDTRLWGQISYHYVIDRDGIVHETLRHDQRGAHVGNHNTGNLGVCYIGGLDAAGKPADTRTPAQKWGLADLVRALHRESPAARIMGHRDWSPDLNGNGRVDSFEWTKVCPCFDVAAWLKELGL